MTTSHIGVSPRLRNPKRAMALLLLPLALLLSACHVNSAVTVTAAGGIIVDIEVTGDKNLIDMSEFSCAAYGTYLNDFPGQLDVHDLTQDDSESLCQISGYTDNGVDGKMLIDNGSSYTLHLPIEDALAGADGIDPDATYSLVIHMPEDVISASGGGTIKGSDVIYQGKISDLKQDIKVVAGKDKGTPSVFWVLGLLVLLLVGAVLASKYLRKKRADADANSKSGNGKGKGGKKSKKSSSGSDSVSVSTADSAVEVAPLPDKYSPKNIDGISESYSEQIGMVDPIPQGSGADVVKRDSVVLELPSETAEVAPIPGMPPRIPMPGESAAAVDQVAEGSEGESKEAKPKKDAEASEFFSTFLDGSDDDDVDEETDL